MYVDSVIRSSYNIPCRLVIVANLRGGEGFLCEFSNLNVYIARLHAAVLNCAAAALAPPPQPCARLRAALPFAGLCAALRRPVRRPQPRRCCPCRRSSHWSGAPPIQGGLTLINYVYYLSVDLFWEAA